VASIPVLCRNCDQKIYFKRIPVSSVSRYNPVRHTDRLFLAVAGLRTKRQAVLRWATVWSQYIVKVVGLLCPHPFLGGEVRGWVSV